MLRPFVLGARYRQEEYHWFYLCYDSRRTVDEEILGGDVLHLEQSSESFTL